MKWRFNDVSPLPPDQLETKELGQIIGQAVQQLPTQTAACL